MTKQELIDKIEEAGQAFEDSNYDDQSVMCREMTKVLRESADDECNALTERLCLALLNKRWDW